MGRTPLEGGSRQRGPSGSMMIDESGAGLPPSINQAIARRPFLGMC
jgi:hypothetical protein